MKQAIIKLLLVGLFFTTVIHAQYSYLHPVDGSKYNSPLTNIVVHFDQTIPATWNGLQNISLVGKQKEYAFSVVPSNDPRILIIQPTQPLGLSDRVLVHIRELSAWNNEAIDEISFQFYVSEKYPALPSIVTDEINMNREEYEGQTDEGNSRSTLAFYQIDVNDPNATPYPIFFRNNAPLTPSDRHIAIVENDGNVIYDLQAGGKGTNFLLQPSGYMSYYAVAGGNCHKIVDTTYNEIDSKCAGNGYTADSHDFIHLANGHSFILIYDEQTVDMSAVYPGGNPNASITGCIIQELDENDNVIVQWRTWDHFSILDCIECDFVQSAFEYCHTNSLEIDDDGNLIISSRLFSEITKINWSTGDIMWRLGGLNNEFNFTNDTIGFSYQHDARRIDNGHITLFDNGNLHTRQVSRGREYQLDEIGMNATLVWSFMHPDSLFGKAMGSMQRLPNGHSLIGWGWANTGDPSVTEVDTSGNIVYEAVLTNLGMSYRFRKYPWFPDSTFTTNVEDELMDSQFTVYPNPATNYFQINTTFQCDQLALLSVDGKLIQQYAKNSNGLFLLPEISNGMYLIKLIGSDKKEYYAKLLVSK